MRLKCIKQVVTGLVMAGVAGYAAAVPVIFTGSGADADGRPVAASASFDIVGDTLTIILTNTAPSHAGNDAPGSTLSGLFWDLPGDPALVPVSATVAPGTIVQGTCSEVDCSTVTDVGGEWGYEATALTGGADRGISSSGYLTTGLPGDIGNFNNGAAGTNLDDPDSLNGINFGIISAAPGFDPNVGLADEPLIRPTATFVLTGVSGLTNADISNVSFQYGTNLNELNVPGDGGGPGGQVPEPNALWLLGLGLVAFAFVHRRRQRS